jgi:hypothetical protein
MVATIVTGHRRCGETADECDYSRHAEQFHVFISSTLVFS